MPLLNFIQSCFYDTWFLTLSKNYNLNQLIGNSTDCLNRHYGSVCLSRHPNYIRTFQYGCAILHGCSTKFKGVYFQIINPYDITDEKYQFEVIADYAGSDVEIFEGYKTENPALYAWGINLDNSPKSLDYSITSIDQLTHNEKCELLSLPGFDIEGFCSR